MINPPFLEKMIVAQKRSIYFLYGFLQPPPGQHSTKLTLNFIMNFKPEYCFLHIGDNRDIHLYTSIISHNPPISSRNSRIFFSCYPSQSSNAWRPLYWSNPLSSSKRLTSSILHIRANILINITQQLRTADNYVIESKYLNRILLVLYLNNIVLNSLINTREEDLFIITE